MRKIIFVVLPAAAMLLCIVELRAEPSARTLSPREMWLTFGGGVDQDCAHKDECDVSTEKCDDMDETSEAQCETHTNATIVNLPNMNHCVDRVGWECIVPTTTYICRTVQRCEYTDDDCETVPMPGGFISEVRVPAYCTFVPPAPDPP